MSAETQTMTGEADQGSCWCCGQARRDDDLVHLGSHPEVGICINCVHYLRRRARDRQAAVVHQRLRGAADSVRSQVTEKGWHQRPVIGPVLRWVDRYLPW
jgi:hypothetical protein